MGELAGILGIISAFATAVDLFLIFYIWWEHIKLNHVLSIYVWAARTSVYRSAEDWQKMYNGKLTIDEILDLKGYEWNHHRDKKGQYYDRRTLLNLIKKHPDVEHISIFGLGNRADGQPVGEQEIRTDT